MITASDFKEALALVELCASTRTEWDIPTADLNRPGMQFCGYYANFPYDRPQVIGKVEMTYLEAMPPETRRLMLKRYFSYRPPCVIICRGMTPPPELIEEAAAADVAVFQSEMVTTRLSFKAANYLNRCMAPRETRHGVLVDVYGTGILLTGDSGVGKSEAALELIKRGHQLIADDVVHICRVTEDRLTGESPEMIRHLMEIRGIGIIDIRAMFGVGSVATRKSIDMMIHLEKWVDGKEY
ncbi:MAG: HPr(Ser) kinase/phosphatase, partial [Clostridia bacterium]|nr:HPr(Ser) kinase/phosphatase [Clostridia bacterium]